MTYLLVGYLMYDMTRYGSSHGLESSLCSGPCKGGYYCPMGSTRMDEYSCGNSSFFCPEESFHRQSVQRGYYSSPEYETFRRYEELMCPPGSFCIKGTRYLCRAGTYGNASMLPDSTCSGFCPTGSYCPEGSITPIPCPSGTYGDSTGLTNHGCTGLCPHGHYCPAGSISGTPCPGGRYGSELGLSNENCSNICSYAYDSFQNIYSHYCAPSSCEEGYYCPRGSVSARQRPCGAGYYCPKSSSAPIPVDPGYYSTNSVDPATGKTNVSDDQHRSAQHPCELGHYCVDGRAYKCPGGYYGAEVMMNSSLCSGPCHAGYYCAEGSSSATQHICGNASVYCPEASRLSMPVPPGHYSHGGTASTRTHKGR